MHSFFYRLFRFEFWPWWALYLPLVPVYLWGVVRSGNWLYFTAVNPAISMGGFFGEEKEDIIERVPRHLRPASVLVQAGEDGLLAHEQAGIGWPCVLKPNIGERGYRVELIDGPDALRRYERYGMDYQIQEYLDLPDEYGILVHSDGDRGGITSLCKKEFMAVEGDGVSTVRELVQKHTRHRLYLDMLEQEHPEELNRIPGQGQKELVHRIGNHSKGTRFLNQNALIDARLEKVFVDLIDGIEGFDYGRFDVRASSFESLRQGNFKVFEFNGVSSDPGHIYDLPNVVQAYASMAKHWSILLKLGKGNMKKGVHCTPVSLFLKQVRGHFFA